MFENFLAESEDVWTKAELDKFVKDLTADGRHPDDEAFDIADGILADSDGEKLKAAVKKFYPNVTDVQGWLANKIC